MQPTRSSRAAGAACGPPVGRPSGPTHCSGLRGVGAGAPLLAGLLRCRGRRQCHPFNSTRHRRGGRSRLGLRGRRCCGGRLLPRRRQRRRCTALHARGLLAAVFSPACSCQRNGSLRRPRRRLAWLGAIPHRRWRGERASALANDTAVRLHEPDCHLHSLPCRGAAARRGRRAGAPTASPLGGDGPGLQRRRMRGCCPRGGRAAEAVGLQAGRQ
mmetsp:Transcript_10805/g.44270  ORF Transcript_10805/g.44270 Transcript_10805/m.44270 type:complete len:214 (-) Transcript_10805:2121-2762(-)